MFDKVKFSQKSMPIIAVSIISVVLIVGLFIAQNSVKMVYFDGQAVFAAQSVSEVESAIEKIKQSEEKKYNCELEVANQIEFKRCLSGKGDILSAKALEKEISKYIDFKYTAQAIMVNGKAVAFLDTKTAAEKVLQDLKEENSAVGENEQLLEVSFKENVKIEPKQVTINKLMLVTEVYELITTGTKNPERYTVKEGDSLWWIARKNDMYVDDIIKANRLKNEDLSIGQELIIEKSQPYINVIAKVEGEKVENIPYETKVIVDKNKGNSVTVKQAGKNGEKSIKYVATKLNGVIAERDIKQEKILSKAVDRVLVKGTKVTQIASRGGGTGSLDWPVYGPITQYCRGGHTAIDIGGSTGTVLKAAESGYVTFAGWSGGYGNLITVDHGNGIVTRYAHCSSFIASVGQKVARGEAVARLGSTGRSTGPHLHFEVLVNGVQQNPLNYLR